MAASCPETSSQACLRAPDAAMGVGFIVVFPLTFLSSAFVPIESMPNVLQWVASWNPVSVLVAACRELFGNPIAPITKHTWPLDHPVLAAFHGMKRKKVAA